MAVAIIGAESVGVVAVVVACKRYDFVEVVIGVKAIEVVSIKVAGVVATTRHGSIRSYKKIAVLAVLEALMQRIHQ